METQLLATIGIPLLSFFFLGIKIVRQRRLIERLAKYYKFADAGFHRVIPFIDKMYVVNMTGQRVVAQND